MPVESGRDTKGPFFRWGKSGKKFHYTPRNEKSRNRAKQNAFKQGIAIEGSPEAAQRKQKGKK